MDELDRYLEKQIKKNKKLYYLNYKQEAIIEKLHKNDFEARLDWLIDNGYQIIKHTTLRAKIKPKTYSLTYDDHILKLTYFDGEHHHWVTTNYHDDVKNVITPNSFKEFKKMFKDRTGSKLLDVFGKTPQEFKIFCPKPLYYINTNYEIAKWYKGVCKEDYSSHYPSQALGLLPDADTRIEIEGYIKPTEEYPFAFYPDTGHIAIYNELDSHEWVNYVALFGAKDKTSKFQPKYGYKDNRTILMRASQFNINEEIMHFYNIKQSAPNDSEDYRKAKMFLLKFIGMMEQVSYKMYASYPLAHLAAVIKWRANIKMFKTIRQIGVSNIIQVCVDGIIHIGDPLGNNIKQIGELNVEFADAEFVHRGINQYIIIDENHEERKHTGLDINTDSYVIMNWGASPKVDFLTYILTNYEIEEKKS